MHKVKGEFHYFRRKAKMLTQKKIIKVANLLYEELKKDKMDLVTYKNMSGKALIEKVKTYNKCLKHGYKLAANRISDHINIIVDRICDEALAIKNQLKKLQIIEEEYGISLKNLIEDLKYLNQSYPSVEFKGNMLTVKTNEIELEDIILGKFMICVNLSRSLTRTEEFLTIKAETPNPSSSSESITHPHVDNEMLCVGEGYCLLKDAISQGRIEDFFKIVDSILHTYNESSAYVGLNEWEGKLCYMCDALAEDTFNCCMCSTDMCERCSFICETCEQVYCESCFDCSSCSLCEYTECSGCAENNMHCCETCGNNICDGCVKKCKICELMVCENCTTNCEACDELVCEEHLKKCEKCDNDVCEKCEKRCKNCEMDLCEECHEKDECNLLAEKK